MRENNSPSSVPPAYPNRPLFQSIDHTQSLLHTSPLIHSYPPTTDLFSKYQVWAFIVTPSLHATPYHQIQYGKREKKSNFTMEKLDKYYFNQMIKFTIKSDVRLITYTLDTMRMALYHCDLPPQNS